MSVDTKAVAERREVSYDSYEEFLDDAERLANTDVQLLGNWTLAQIYTHLASGFNAAIDGASFRPPFFIRSVVRLFMKKKFIYDRLPPGFQIPKDGEEQFLPDAAADTHAALEQLRHAVERLKTTPERVEHPVLGHLTLDESDNFNLRHAELHMSFVRPVND